MERELGRYLIAIGAMLAVVGFLLTFGGRLGLGRLPGDFSVSGGNLRFFAPLGTCLLLSVVLTVLLRLFGNR